MKKFILFLLPVIVLTAFAIRLTNKTITGTISDERGVALAGVTVTAKGMRAGSVSDAHGRYRIVIPEKMKTLIFSITGKVRKEEQINDRSIVDVTLLSTSAGDSSMTLVTAQRGILPQQKEMDYTGSDKMTSPAAIGMSGNYTYSRAEKSLREDESNTEEYSNISENGFHTVSDDPLSTFSIDVDAASYSNVRRFLNEGELPPEGAVRTEEMINYFKYQYPQPTGTAPFSINTEISDCPWNSADKLVLIGLQGKQIPTANLPASNLVFLIDVSGSMFEENKLPLVKASLKMLTDQLREQDRISIVVYAGNAGLVLAATSGADKIKIKTAIDALEAGGSTAGGAGIQLAYKTAEENFMRDGNNRIILCTDGDFNVGESSDDALVRLVEKERESHVFLTVLGFGMGNYKDSKMEELADKGNGNHAYIDGIDEAKKVLVSEFGGTLFTIAKDVKLQVEFNPAKVAGYRLIGYENRLLNKEDFNDDKKDAGELGSGHTVTALYEIVPAGVSSPFLKTVDPLKYQKPMLDKVALSGVDELLTVKFRYKAPAGDNSDLIVHTVLDSGIPLTATSDNFRFATCVAQFSMLLQSSKYLGSTSYGQVLKIANGALGGDSEGYRKEFIGLVKKAAALTDSKAAK